MKNGAGLLLYDAECPLCNDFAGLMKRFDIHHEIDLLPLQSYIESSDRFTYDELMSDVHLLMNDGRLFTGKDAAYELIMLVPAMRPYRWMLKGQVGKGVAAVGYGTMKSFRRCYKCVRRRR